MMKNMDTDWEYINKGDDGVDIRYTFHYDGNYGKLNGSMIEMISESIRLGQFKGCMAGDEWELSIKINDYPLLVILPESREKLATIVAKHCEDKSEYENSLKARLNHILADNSVNYEIDGFTKKGYAVKERER